MTKYTNGKPQSVMLSEICKIIGGTSYGITDREISKIAHIKRHIEEGCLFFAFQTWRVDTYSNIFTAIEKKAAAIVTDKYIDDYPCIVVKDSHQAFMDLSEWYRNNMNADIIAITGSIGKTSTKEMVASVLQNSFNIEKNQENSNSSDLAAMNIMDLKNTTEKLVQEVAMQDIHSTSMAIHPTICIITNIGYSHVESFGSRENIFKEKIKILDGMQPQDIAIINIDDDMLATFAPNTIQKVITYALENNNADVTAENIVKCQNGYSFDVNYYGKTYPVKTNCPGKHNVLNALASFIVGKLYGMTASDIATGIANFQPTGYRQNIFEKDGITVYADCFNAAPDSVKGALDTLEEMDIVPGGKRIAILGDMLELGTFSQELHEIVGAHLNKKNLDTVILYGEEVTYTHACITNPYLKVKYVLKREDLIDVLKKECMSPNNILLFKGSHGMELEGVIDELFGTKFSHSFFENTYVLGRLKREKCDLTGYFREKKHKTAAIYGISVDEGELISTLTDAGVNVKYAIDRKAKYLPKHLYKIPVYSLDDTLEEVDMVFISLRTYSDELVAKINSKLKADILSYKKLVSELLTKE